MSVEKKGWLEYWVNPANWTFVGDFEGMYRDFEDPWLCQRRNRSAERRVVLALLQGRDFPKVLDLGCGLGGFTDLLRQYCRARHAWGVDIAATAIDRAQRSYPECTFLVRDVTREGLPPAEGGYDLIMVQEVIWYILPHLHTIFRQMHDALAADGVCFIEQSFPADQKFGREYLTSPEMLIGEYLAPAGFEVETQFRQVLPSEAVLLLKLTKGSRP